MGAKNNITIKKNNLNQINMQKFILIFSLFAATASAQAQTTKAHTGSFRKGSIVLNLGVSTPDRIDTDLSDYKVKIPAISVSPEFGIANLFNKTGKGAIGMAPVVAYAVDDYDGADRTRMTVGLKGNFHYQFVPKLDTYLGVQGGYRIVKRVKKEDDPHLPTPPIGMFRAGGIVGARYYFTNSLGVMAELGYGNATILTGGIALKIK
jgi:hypothetical protein